jgi:hypothetical protein
VFTEYPQEGIPFLLGLNFLFLGIKTVIQKMLNSLLFDIKQLLSFFMPATSLFCPCMKNLSLKSYINKQSDMVDSSN